MSAATDLLANYQHIIRDLRFITATGGIFEVRVDGSLIYSKQEMGRHAEPGEVLALFTELVGDVRRYGQE